MPVNSTVILNHFITMNELTAFYMLIFYVCKSLNAHSNFTHLFWTAVVTTTLQGLQNVSFLPSRSCCCCGFEVKNTESIYSSICMWKQEPAGNHYSQLGMWKYKIGRYIRFVKLFDNLLYIILMKCIYRITFSCEKL